MSPASQGSLEVERYIGSNLISSCARVNNFRSNGKGRKPDAKLVLQRTTVSQNCGEAFNRHGAARQGYSVPNMLSPCGCRGNLNVGPRPGQFGAAGWTGMPLISVAGDTKKKNQQFQDRPRNVTEDDSNLRTPLSRLAIHTQGAPLILSGRCYNGRKNQNRGNQVRGNRGEIVIRRSNKYKDNLHGHGGTSDCLSVASDESSGSGHSENCLPRIIKPRKRRKKDRKPSVPLTENYPNEETGGNVSENTKTPCDKKPETEVAGAKSPQKCDTKPNSVPGPPVSNGSQCDEASEDESHGPKLHHTFEDVTESESPSYVCSPSSCQCHYCDPSGIWDAPSNFFSNRNTSAFLTPPPNSNKSFHYFSHSDMVLRRSWSEPMPDPESSEKALGKTFQLPLYGLPLRSNSFVEPKTTKSRDWTAEVTAKRWDSVKSCDVKKEASVDGEECKKVTAEEKVNLSYGSQCLEVSTEIVTSPNGHRDIEIRFYSTSPPST